MNSYDKDWISKATYKDLLLKNRFGVSGDPIFMGELGKIFTETMHKRKDELSPEKQVLISKEVGWT